MDKNTNVLVKAITTMPAIDIACFVEMDTDLPGGKMVFDETVLQNAFDLHNTTPFSQRTHKHLSHGFLGMTVTKPCLLVGGGEAGWPASDPVSKTLFFVLQSTQSGHS